MTNKLVALLVLVLVGACTPPPPRQQLDQCVRQQAFERCLAQVPNGPVVAGRYNDWAEVVAECDEQSRSVAYRSPAAIAPECKDFR